MATSTSAKRPSWATTPVLLGAIIVILVLLVVFLGGLAAGHYSDNSAPAGAHQRFMDNRANGPASHGGLRGLMGDNQNVVTGAVVSVSGDSFTVAGGGTTTQVKTTSSTQFRGANSVKTNDTVVAVGTKDGDTLNATRVAVNPLKDF
jgi:hypothetical protein